MAVEVSITTTSGTLLPARASRAAYLIQNPTGSPGSVWVNLDGGTAIAAPPCIELARGDSFSWVGGGALNAIAATATTIVTVVER